MKKLDRYQLFSLLGAGAGLVLYLLFPVVGGIVVLTSVVIGTLATLLYSILICKDAVYGKEEDEIEVGE